MTNAYRSLTDRVTATYGWRCHLCQTDIDPRVRTGGEALHIDHVLPQSRGGCHHIGNLRPSHARCNQRKGHRYSGGAVCAPCRLAASRPAVTRPAAPVALPPRPAAAGMPQWLAWTLGIYLLVTVLAWVISLATHDSGVGAVAAVLTLIPVALLMLANEIPK